MLVYNFEKWHDLNEDRITPINVDKFKDLLKKYCLPNIKHCLYKKIINPQTPMGLFFKSKKEFESHIKEISIPESEIDKTFPDRQESLVCFNYIEKEEGTTFVVFPFKSALFTITSNVSDSYKKGYWTEKIKWLERLDNRELWTESPCLIVEKSMWDEIKKEM